MQKKRSVKSCVHKKEIHGLVIVFLLSFLVVIPGKADAGTFFPQSPETVRGRVTDTKGFPLPGVTLRLEGSGVGMASDNDGCFTFRSPQAEGVLIASFIGYKTVKVPFRCGVMLEIKLEESISELDEVRVIGYGTQTKREMVGALSSVKAAEIQDIPSPSVGNLLQGRVAGMSVVNATGSPGGGGTSITIRGHNSLSIEKGRRGSDPLWIIDGVPMYSFTSPITGLNTLSEIDPKDIETLEVAKDAASGSIYGSRAANGVIIVTTKQGRLNQKARLSANVSQTFSFHPYLADLTGGNAERRLRLQALNNYQEAFFDESTNSYKYPSSLEEAYEQGVAYGYFFGRGNGAAIDILQDSLNPYYNHSSNLFDYYMQTGKVTDANLQLSGGSTNIAYNIGLGYYTERGVLRGTGFNRIKLLSNLHFRPYHKLSGNLRFYIARTGRNRAGKGRDIFNFQQAGELETIPDELMTTSTLLPGPGSESFEELTRRYEETKEKSESYRIRSSFDLTYKFIEGLKLKSSVSFDYSQQNQNIFLPSSLDEYNETYSSGQIGRNLMLLNENLLTYKKTFNDSHTLDLLAGLSFQSDENNNLSGYGRRAASDLIHYVTWNGNAYDPAVSRQLKEFNSSFEKSTMVGMFVRAGYNYRNRYLASVTVRRDGSSKFGEKTRWGTFPSYGIGYAFSEEPYMSWSRGVLDYGKLRASYGTSGKQFESPYLAFGQLQPGNLNFGGNPTIEPEWFYGLINRELTWEQTRQWDLGLDLDFFNYRLGVTVDYYHRYTDKLLYSVPLAGNYNGYEFQWQNAYGISNQGIEIQVKGDLIRNDKLTWDLTVNFAHNWNRLEKSTNGRDFQNGEYVNNVSVIGRPLNGIYAFADDGFYQQQGEVPFIYEDGRKKYLGTNNSFYRPGDRVIRDVDGNGKIDNKDRVYCGSPLPAAQGGIISTLNWNNFDLNLLFNYVIDRHILNAGRGASIGTQLAMNPEAIARPVFGDLSDIRFWQQPGDRADLPANRLENGLYNFSTFLSSNVERANYIKLKTITLGYTLPERLKAKTGFGARVFVSAENLFTITNYSGGDPESVDTVTGIDYYNNYPLSRRLTIGLTLNF